MERSSDQDAVGFLQSQHDEVRRLFQAVEGASGDARRDPFQHLVRLLAVHETAEEMVVYPAVATSGDEGRAIAEARRQEEDQAKKMLSDLEKLDLSSAAFDQQLGAVQQAVLSHAAAEEREVFPLLRQEQDPARLQRMTSALKVAECLAPTHPHKTAPESAVGNLLVGPFVAMVDRTRDALSDVLK